MNQYEAFLSNPANNIDPLGLIIQVSSAQQSLVLDALSKFVRGKLSFNTKGHLQRGKSADDCGIEANVDRLIGDERIYEIIPERRGIGGVYEPWSQVRGDFLWQQNTGEGGRIYFDPNPDPSTTYYKVNFWSKTDPHTASTILAHELLGRAIADYNSEPQGRLGSSVRDDANSLAVQRAAPAYERMGVTRRYGY